MVIQVQGGTGLVPRQNLSNNAHLSKLSYSYFENSLMSTKMALLPTFPNLVSVNTLNTPCVNFPLLIRMLSQGPLICTALLFSLSDLEDRNFQRKWQNNYMLANVIP